MGSKGTAEQPAPPPVVADTTQPGMDPAMLQSLVQAMAAQSAMVAAMAAPPPQPELPPIYTTPEIDWGEKLDQLNAKARGETAGELARKKGRLDTVHTGLLLDDEEATTTRSSILG